MRAGDRLELAIWLTGTEPEHQIEHWKTVVCTKLFNEASRQYGLEAGPPEFTLKQVGEDRVPIPPPHVAGPGIRLLVAEATLGLGRPVILKETGFAIDLDKNDLAKLRQITRRAHAKRAPGDRLSDRHCDQIIEALGPDVAVKSLRDNRDGRSLN